MNIRAILNIESEGILEKYTFEGIPTSKVEKCVDIVIELSHCRFETEIEGITYSSETAKPICVAIDILADSLAVAAKLYRDIDGKYFFLFAKCENGDISRGTVVVENTDDYQDFLSTHHGCAAKNLMLIHLEAPDIIPVGCCA